MIKSDEMAGRVALVTGASSGVGRHVATALAAAGAKVVCCARRKASLDALVWEIKATAGEALAVQCDVSDAQSIAAAFDAAEATFGVVDTVISNAGINHPGGALRLNVDRLDAILSVNLRGAFLTAREGADRMINRGAEEEHRRIVFVASILGTKPMRGAAVYAATKAGVILLARSLALEWAQHRITVNTLCPGFMRTEIINHFFETENGQSEIARWPHHRFMDVVELDPPLMFLLSPRAGSTTGATLMIDEGQSLS